MTTTTTTTPGALRTESPHAAAGRRAALGALMPADEKENRRGGPGGGLSPAATVSAMRTGSSSLCAAAGGATPMTPIKCVSIVGPAAAAGPGSASHGGACTPMTASAFAESGPGCGFCERKNEAMAKMKLALKAMKAANRDLAQTSLECTQIIASLKAVKQAELKSSTPKPEPPKPEPVAILVAGHRQVARSHVEYDLRVSYGRGQGHVRPVRFLEVRALHQRVLCAAELAARATWTAPADPQHVHTLEKLRKLALPSWGVASNLRRFNADFLAQRQAELQAYMDDLVLIARRAGRSSPMRRIIGDWLEIDAADLDAVWRDDRLAPLSVSPTCASRRAVREEQAALEAILP